VASGGTLSNQWSFIITDFNSNLLPFEIAEHNTTTGFIAGSFLADLSNTQNTFGYIYFNNPDINTSQENRAALNSAAVASWHLPNEVNFKPGVATSDFNSAFSSTTGLRGAAANFADTATDIRTVRSSLLNGLANFSIETMFMLNILDDIHQLVTIPETVVGTELNIRTHNSPETTVPIDGLKLRMNGPGGASEHFYRSLDLVINRWYHMIAVFRSTGLYSLYIDGDLITPTAVTTPAVTPGAPTFVGTLLTIGGFAGNTDYMNGKIDDVLIISGTIGADSAKWRARNSLYPDSSFTLAAIEAPGTANDNMAGIYFDINNSSTFTINLNDHLVSPAGRTVSGVTIATPPSAGEGAVTILSSTSVRYTPPASFSGTPDFTLNVSTA
jgi:hypothetical protein